MSSLAKNLINKTLDELDTLISDPLKKQLISDIRLLLEEDIEGFFVSLKGRLQALSLERDQLKKTNNDNIVSICSEDKTVLVLNFEEISNSNEVPFFENIN